MSNETSVRPARLHDLNTIRNAYHASWRPSYAGILALYELDAPTAIRAQDDGRNGSEGPNRVVLV